MSWSYSGNPASSTRDEVRYLVGDTDVTDQLTSDEEINWALSQYPDTTMAAAVVCEAIAAKLGTQVDKKIGSLSVSASQRADNYRKRASALRLNAASLAEVFVGGLSESAKDSLDQDTDRVQPSFRFGQDDNYKAPDERQNTQEQDEGT